VNFDASDKRVRLYLGDDEGNGSWVLDASHTDAMSAIRIVNLGIIASSENGFIAHYDDVKHYAGEAG
jgi:hypothetical protein